MEKCTTNVPNAKPLGSTKMPSRSPQVNFLCSQVSLVQTPVSIDIMVVVILHVFATLPSIARNQKPLVTWLFTGISVE